MKKHLIFSLVCLIFYGASSFSDDIDEAVFALQQSQELRKSGTVLALSGGLFMGSGAAMAYNYFERDGGAFTLGLGISALGFGGFLEYLALSNFISARRILKRSVEESTAPLSFHYTGNGVALTFDF
jgi:hypothetical protein